MPAVKREILVKNLTPNTIQTLINFHKTSSSHFLIPPPGRDPFDRAASRHIHPKLK